MYNDSQLSEGNVISLLNFLRGIDDENKSDIPFHIHKAYRQAYKHINNSFNNIILEKWWVYSSHSDFKVFNIAHDKHTKKDPTQPNKIKVFDEASSYGKISAPIVFKTLLLYDDNKIEV